MTKTEKRTKAFNNICSALEQVSGIEKEDVKMGALLGRDQKNKQSKDHIGLDQIDMMIFMLYIEQEFNSEIDDIGFVPRKDTCQEQLWENRTVKDLVNYCADNIINDQ